MAKKDSKILIIDDDQSIRKVMTVTLQDAGYQVFTAQDGESGLKIFADERPSITLTDLRMPGMDGIEVLKEIKTLDSDKEVIVITAYADIEPVLLAVNLNTLFGYLIKPVQPETLKSAVFRALQNYQASKEMYQTMNRLEAENVRLRLANQQLLNTTDRMVEIQSELQESMVALQEAYRRMSDLAHRDELTQLHNRRYFVQILETEFNRCRPAKLFLSIKTSIFNNVSSDKSTSLDMCPEV